MRSALLGQFFTQVGIEGLIVTYGNFAEAGIGRQGGISFA